MKSSVFLLLAASIAVAATVAQTAFGQQANVRDNRPSVVTGWVKHRNLTEAQRTRQRMRLLGKTRRGCDLNEFRCSNGLCIMSKWLCDKLDDCGDYSDEINCPGSPTGCPPNRFDCGNGQCVARGFRCDGEQDCTNGADETNCPSRDAAATRSVQAPKAAMAATKACSADEFTCADKQCIPRSLVCNRETDCRDRSDEQSCVYCYDEQFACKSRATNLTVKCIVKRFVCDGLADCDDGADEDAQLCSQRSSDQSATFLMGKAPRVTLDYEDGNSRRKSLVQQLKPEPSALRSSSWSGGGDARDNAFAPSTAASMPSSSTTAGVFSTVSPATAEREGEAARNSRRTEHASSGSSPDHVSGHAHQETSRMNSFRTRQSNKQAVRLRVYDTPQTKTEGNDVVFRCRDEGETRLPVKWSRADGKLLSQRHKQLDGRLTLVDVTPDDAGVYRCTVLGGSSSVTVSASAHLTVLQQDNRLQELKQAIVREDTDCPSREAVCHAYRQLLPLLDQRRLPRDNFLWKLCRK